MFDYFKKAQKMDKKSLFLPIDAAIATFETETYDDNLERLIGETGKSRSEILSIILNDDEVEGCRDDIESAIRATPFSLWGDDLDEDTQNELIKLITVHLKTFAELAVLAKFNGHAIAEYVYKQEPTGRIVLDKVLSREGELDFYRFKTDGTVHFNKHATPMVIDTHIKHLVLTHRASHSRPMGQMTIIKAYPSVLLRSKSWAYLGQFIKRYAQPYVIAKTGNGLEFPEFVANFANRLYQFVGGGATTIDKDSDIVIHQLQNDGKAFEMAEQLCNHRIQKLLLGRVKTSDQLHGSRSANEIDDKSRIDRIGSYLELTKEAVQHALNAMIVVNEQFGVPIPAGQVWFDFKTEKVVDKIRAERDKLYLDTGTITLTKDYYKDVVGFEEHHFKIVEPATPPKTTQNKEQDLPLSLFLSDDGKHKHTHAHDEDFDEPLTDKQLNIAQAKRQISEALVDDSTDFADFEKKLSLLNFDNDAFVEELTKQGMGEFLKGLSGVVDANH